jgi:hypothetical protein
MEVTRKQRLAKINLVFTKRVGFSPPSWFADYTFCGRPGEPSTVVYAAKFFRALVPASGVSGAKGIETVMSVPFPRD